MESNLSYHSSSDVTVVPVHFDGSPLSLDVDSEMNTLTAFELVTSPHAQRRTEMVTATAPYGTLDNCTDELPNSQPLTMWGAILNGTTRILGQASSSAGKLLERLLEPKYGDEVTQREPISRHVVHMNDGVHGYGFSNAITRQGVEYLSEEEEREEEAGEEPSPLIEVDLVSTLRAYRKNPNECFGHLVAAALSSRSPENPVTGDELKEARLNLYLIRKVIDSQCLKMEDESVQAEIQRCVDSIIPSESRRIPLTLYEDLLSLLKLHFVRLNPGQYAVMRGSGFEFVKLLCEYPHVLPPTGLNFFSFNIVRFTWYLTLFLMIFNIVSEVLVLVSIALLLVYAPKIERKDIRSVNINITVITYGLGYATHLISMIFLMRGKERNVVYGKMIWPFPSPYLHVIPVLPLHNFVSLFTYLRYRMANQNGKHIAILHDIVSAQVLSSLCFALCVALPQLIYQTLMIANVVDNKEYFPQWNRSFALLTVSTIITCLLSLVRIFSVFTLCDSINCFGFACFGFHSERIIEKYSAVVRTIYVSLLFVAELNIFFLIASAMSFLRCVRVSLVIMTLTSISTLISVVVLLFLFARYRSVFYLMWILPILTALQITLLIYHDYITKVECMFFWKMRGGIFVFPYAIWALFFFFLFLWMIQWIVLFVLKKKPALF